MALTLLINGFITVSELRVQMGRPTVDTADPGYISDAELEALIQRYHDDAVEHARFIAGQRTDQGALPAPKEFFAPVSIALSTSANQIDLLEGPIPSTYYPFVFQVTDDAGKEYVYDDQIGRTVATSFTQRYIYKTIGSVIYVSPGINGNTSPSTIHVHLATETDVWNYLFEGDLVRKYNERIVAAAKDMLQSLVVEGTRLEQIIASNDGVPGDLT